MSMFFQYASVNTIESSSSYTLVNYTHTDGRSILYKFPQKHFINFINDNSLRDNFYTLLGKTTALKLDLENEIGQSTNNREIKQKKLSFTNQLLEMLEKGTDYIFSYDKVSLKGLSIANVNVLCTTIGADPVLKGSSSRTKQLMEDVIDFFNNLPSTLNTISEFKDDEKKAIIYCNITDFLLKNIQ